jgi:hypothetical protein
MLDSGDENLFLRFCYGIFALLLRIIGCHHLSSQQSNHLNPLFEMIRVKSTVLQAPSTAPNPMCPDGMRCINKDLFHKDNSKFLNLHTHCRFTERESTGHLKFCFRSMAVFFEFSSCRFSGVLTQNNQNNQLHSQKQCSTKHK